jgi:hypothetical protein
MKRCRFPFGTWRELLLVAAVVVAFYGRMTFAAEPETPATESGAAPSGENEAETERFFARWSKSTLGGVQLWNDELCFRDYRIQRHALTGHCRLLDGSERRVTWGTYETCEKELDRIKAEKQLGPMTGRVVIVLHGLGGWRTKMNPLCEYLNKQGFQTINVSYASTRGDIETHAQALAKIISHLDQVDEIDFIGHSMGNVIIRHYLADTANTGAGGVPDRRVKRFVMLAPPNHGAELANSFSDLKLFEIVLGEAAMELGPRWPEVEKQLITPTCEFGIIAGGRGDANGYNSHLEGDDDFVLSVATTKLDGARDFIILPVLHPITMNDKRVQEYTANFLAKGYFTTEDQRHPLPEPAPPK